MLRFYGYTPTALIYESHFICKWNQSHNSGSWEGRQQPLRRLGFRRWPWCVFFKFKRALTPPPPVHHLDSFKWLLLLESCQRVQGWAGMWVSACQVENEIAVRRWRLNSVFNAWRVSEGVAQKKRGGTEMKVKALQPCQKISMRCINMPESAPLCCNKGDLLSPYFSLHPENFKGPIFAKVTFNFTSVF